MRRKANRFLAAVRAAQDDNADKSSQTDPETPSAQMEDASARSVPELTCTCCPIHTMNTRMGIDEDAITQSVPELISTCCPLIHTRSTQMENNEELREDASVPKIICTCCPVHTMTAQSETQDVPKLTCTCCRIHTTTNPDSPPESPVTIMSRELRTSKGRANAFISYMRARGARSAEQSSQTDETQDISAQMKNTQEPRQDTSTRSVPKLTRTCCPVHVVTSQMETDGRP